MFNTATLGDEGTLLYVEESSSALHSAICYEMGKTMDGKTSVLLHLHYVFNMQRGSWTSVFCLAAVSKMEMMVSI